MRYTVFFVDDEPWALKGLLNLLDWPSEGFSVMGSYTDAAQAIADVSQKEPDVIVTDITMPRMNGLSMMKTLRGMGYAGAFVVISGYDEFQYAQEAMEHGAFAYILKPLDRKQVQPVFARLLRHLAGASLARLSLYPESADPDLLGRLLAPPMGASLFVVTVRGAYEPRPLADERMLSIFRTPDRSLYLMASAESVEAIAARYDRDACRANATLGLSEAGSLEDFPRLLRHAERALFERVLHERHGAYVYREVNPELCAELAARIFASSDSSAADEALKDLRRRGGMQDVALLVNRVIATLAAQGHLLEPVDVFSVTDLAASFGSMAEIARYLREMLQAARRTKAPPEGSAAHLVDDMCTWITAHHGEPIRLGDLSERFHLSVPYICELFKRHTGKTLTEFLTQVRMERAIELLLTTAMPLGSISESVGYMEYSYFGRLFKRFTGLSPDRYRRERSALYGVPGRT